MFRTAELGRKVAKDDFDAAASALRIEILELQQKLRQADFATVIVFAGVDGAGKNQTINLMNEWMDPRWIATRAYSQPSDEERERPEFWRYWRDLPQRGRIGLFLRSWYSSPVLDAAYRRIAPAELDARLDRIAAFENALAADGTLIVKFWLHLSHKAQKRRLKSLAKDPHESWRVTEADWQHWRMYDQFVAAAEQTIIRTGLGHAPWTIVEGEDPRYRELTVMTTFRDAALRHLELRALSRNNREALLGNGGGTSSLAPHAAGDSVTDPAAAAIRVLNQSQPSILDALNMTKAADKATAEAEEPRLTARLNHLYRAAKEHGLTSVLVFEGWDAAGKGGTIRRITAAMDARDYQVIPIAAPTDEERAQHYLWRFWRHLTRAGRVTIFDRSWYGRVLVERVENLATQEEWRRAYAEINHFEQQLIDHGIVLVKFWMNITKDEQLARFERRQAIPWKRWKLTEEDWRNREKWDLYAEAVNDMIEKTSTRLAPWTLVEANCKRFARLRVLETVCETLETALAHSAELAKTRRKARRKGGG
ncbi:MAG: polyphosphate:AMP phosphotransferase [Azospirillum sp.]|nr:polyphosphate:AMP phosphotransferase [Azospirillum sp.]